MRISTLQMVVSEPDPNAAPTECPTCGYDAVVAFPSHYLTEDGVSKGGSWPVCMRCYAEKNPS